MIWDVLLASLVHKKFYQLVSNNMARKEHEVGGAISKEVDDGDDDKRLYECARKYQTIVKQFDELLGLIDDGTTPPKRRKGRKGSTSGAMAAVSSNQPSNEALVQTVTRLLHELRATPADSECSRSTKG